MEKRETGYKKIMVIDEQGKELDLLAAVLGAERYIVEIATDIKEAVGKVKNLMPDLILLNVMIQGMKGYELCAEVRNETQLPYIPILFFTSVKIDQQELTRGFDVGADGYIQKPFDYPELFSKIRILIRTKGLYDELAAIRNELARYVSIPTFRSIEMKVKKGIEPVSETKRVTILFSDIRGFTNIAAQKEQPELFRMLNNCLIKQIKVIEAHHGMIDKLSGDEIMAIFEGEEMAENALRCGKSIVEALKDPREYPLPDWMNVGIGINTGPSYMGSLGSETFRKDTVIGHTVNLAARLCGIAKKSQILFTEDTKKLITGKDFSYDSIGRVTLKGIPEPIEVFILKY